MKNQINFLDTLVEEYRETHPDAGLPEDILFLVSRMTPIVNVDLLVKDEHGNTLLSWRDEKTDIENKDTDWPGCGTGWHLPGSIVRYKEKLTDRVEKCMESELGVVIPFKKNPIANHELILDHKTRGHFISFLFSCQVNRNSFIDYKKIEVGQSGHLVWHKNCPDDLIKLHDIYRNLIYYEL
jgi:colanic acid biosynthesis protein WcaH